LTRAVVFGYSEVGARCLAVLYEAGVEVPLVCTHADDPGEVRWFASVAELAVGRGSAVTTDEPATHADLVPRIAALVPDFVFSFYYRRMLPPAVLGIPRQGALNMHGSLLPRYRGRAPVNWALVHGETETGASLHYMVEKPDAGNLVDQAAVPIGPDDTAVEVAARVADAAVVVLRRSLPGLIAGTAPSVPLDLARGSYFGGRRPADGAFQWTWAAARIHNLVRAVAPPFPGAFATVAGRELRVHRTVRGDEGAAGPPRLACEDGRLIAVCGDGARLEIAEALLDGKVLTPTVFVENFGTGPVGLS
jgi:methionyl-tRNA formyltransferase